MIGLSSRVNTFSHDFFASESTLNFLEKARNPMPRSGLPPLGAGGKLDHENLLSRPALAERPCSSVSPLDHWRAAADHPDYFPFSRLLVGR